MPIFTALIQASSLLYLLGCSPVLPQFISCIVIKVVFKICKYQVTSLLKLLNDYPLFQNNIQIFLNDLVSS